MKKILSVFLVVVVVMKLEKQGAGFRDRLIFVELFFCSYSLILLSFIVYLIVEKVVFLQDPDPRQLFKTIDSREWDEVVDEDIWHPQVLHEVQIKG